MFVSPVTGYVLSRTWYLLTVLLVITFQQIGRVNLVGLTILLIGGNEISLAMFAPVTLVSRDGFHRPVPRQCVFVYISVCVALGFTRVSNLLRYTYLNVCIYLHGV